MNPIECIAATDGAPLVYIVRASFSPAKTTFVTSTDMKQQAGFVVYPKGGAIPRHYHQPVERHIVGTSEVFMVRSGRCELDVYDEDRVLVATRELNCGDVTVVTGGGHAFRMLEDTVLLEVKQGPYLGKDDKVNF